MVNFVENNNTLDIFYISSDSNKQDVSSMEVFPSLSQADPNLGRVLIFINVPKKKVTEPIAHLISSEFKTNYFSAIVSNAEQAFEYALQKVNIALKSHLKNSDDLTWLKNLSALLLSNSGEEVHMSFVGEIHPYICQDYRINRLEDNEERKFPHYTKVFSSIISGKITKTSALVVTNSAVLDYFSLESLKKFALEKKIKFADSLTRLLTSENLKMTFFGVCLKLGNDIRSNSTDKTLEQILRPVTTDSARRSIPWIKKFSAWVLLIIVKETASVLKKVLSKGFIPSVLYNLSSNTIGKIIKVGLLINKKNFGFKIASYFFILSLSIFFYSLSLSYYKNQDVKRLNLFDETIKSLYSQKEKAESVLIYNDKESAALILASIDASLTNLDASAGEQAQEKDKLKKEIETLLKKINNLKQVTSIQTIYNLTQQIAASSLVHKDGALLIANTETGIAIELKKNKKQSDKTFTLPKGTKDFDFFNDKIYSLRPSRNAIETNGKKWNVDNLDLSSASSLAIDGFIYTISSSNRIDRWLKGNINATFSIPKNLSASPSVLFTNENSKNLYALDRSKGIIFVMNKNGKLTEQLENDNFRQALDLYIDEKVGQGYILTSSDLKMFKLP